MSILYFWCKTSWDGWDELQDNFHQVDVRYVLGCLITGNRKARCFPTLKQHWQVSLDDPRYQCSRKTSPLSAKIVSESMYTTQQLYHIMLIVYWIWKSDPAFNRVPASLILVRNLVQPGSTLLQNYYAPLCLWLHSYIHPSQRRFFTTQQSKFTPPESIYHQVSHQKTDLFEDKRRFQNNNPKAIGNAFWSNKKCCKNPSKSHRIQPQSACFSRMSFVNWLCSLLPSSLPRFNSATVECVLRGYEFELFEGIPKRGRFCLDRKLGSATCFVENKSQLVKNRHERYRLNPKKNTMRKFRSDGWASGRFLLNFHSLTSLLLKF